MKQTLITGLILLTFNFALAQSINIPSGVKIEMSGEVEVEFIDVEGKGGASNEDNFLKKIETRSPHTRIDKAVLDFRVFYSDNITYRISFNFDDDKGFADKHYLLYKKDNSRIEVGKNRPAVALKRSTEAYPLIGTSYWKGRQYHIDYEHTLNNFILGSSIALKRPLGYDDAAEDKSFRMLVYDDAEKIDGQTVEYGVRGGINLDKLKILGWGYIGKLIDDEDWKKRLHYDFDYYATLEPDNVLNDEANVNHYWAGCRVDYTLFNTLIRGEYIYSKDGFLAREGYYGELSRDINLPLSSNPLMLLARYGELNIDPRGDVFVPLLKDPQTWNRSLITLAAAYNITDYAKIKFEYYILDEETGDTEDIAEAQNRALQSSVNDNQMLIQLELKF